MITQTASYHDIVTQLPADTVVTFHHVRWEAYEELLNQVGEARGLRLSYNDGILTIMTLSTEHEKYAEFIKSLVGVIRLRRRLNILFFAAIQKLALVMRHD